MAASTFRFFAFVSFIITYFTFRFEYYFIILYGFSIAAGPTTAAAVADAATACS